MACEGGLRHYIWDRESGDVYPTDLMTWAAWFEAGYDRQLRQDVVDGVRVSTVFLGIDHNWSSYGPPILWETMIFGGARAGYQERYATEEEAVAGHAAALVLARSAT